MVFPAAFIGGYPIKFDGDDQHKYRASAVDVPGLIPFSFIIKRPFVFS